VKKLSILFLNEYLPPNAPGGAEWSMVRLAEALSNAGHSVTIAAPDLGDEPLLPPGVKVLRYGFAFRPKHNRMLSPYVTGTPWFYRNMASKVRRMLGERRFDLVHAQSVTTVPPAVLLGKRLGVPAVATIRDYRMLCPMAICLMREDYLEPDCGLLRFQQCIGEYRDIYGIGQRPWDRAKLIFRRNFEWVDWKLRKSYLERLDGVAFVGNTIMEIYRQAARLPAVRAVVPNVPPAPAARTSKEGTAAVLEKLGIANAKIVLYAGRVSVGKGACLLRSAAEVVLAENEAAVFVLAGRVETGDAVPPRYADRYLTPGMLSRRDMDALLAACRMVVMPSVWQEPFSRVILEAMAAAKPVVATRSGGNPEVVKHGENGLLVERNDPEALAEAIGRLLKDDALARDMGRRGSEMLAQEYGEEDLVDRTIDFYLSVLQGSTP